MPVDKKALSDGWRSVQPSEMEVVMSNQRFVTTDRLWQHIAPLLPGQPTDRGVPARDNRLFLEPVLRRMRTGATWPDLHAPLANGNSQLGRCRRWAASPVVQRLFEALSGDPDRGCVPIDGAIVPVHQQAAGPKGAVSASAWDALAAG